MRPDRQHRQVAVVADLGEHLRAHRPDGRPRLAHRRAAGRRRCPRDAARSVAQVRLRDVEQAGGGRVGDLRALLAGEPVREQVGDEQQAARRRRAARRPAAATSWNTVLNGCTCSPVRRVQVRRRHLGEDPLRHAGGAAVAVVDGVAEQGAVGVEEPVVDGPGVDADAGEPAGVPGRRAQAVEDAAVQREDVPVQGRGAGRAGPPADPHRGVREPVDLVQLDALLPRRPEHPADDDAPAGRAEVDRREGGVVPAGTVRTTRTAGPATGGGGPGVARRHRRNAAATPESTGTCRPVVCTRSGPVRAKTAAATCSGSTSRLSRVRWA